jgi:hypothetical protein
MKNKLIPDSVRENYRMFSGPDTATRHVFPEHRRSGRTTALALHYIATAMLQTGKPVKINDHVNHRKAHESCFRMVQDIIRKLELKCFIFNRRDLILTYDVFE